MPRARLERGISATASEADDADSEDNFMLMAAVNWHSVFFLLFGLLASGFALGVLLTSNVVRMAGNLLVCLAATAGLFMLAGAEFVGAMQIMIYVGGTLVLLVFGVMLTAQASFISMKTTAGEWIVAGIVGGSLLYLLLQSAFSVRDWTTVRTDQSHLVSAESKVEAPLGMGLLGMPIPNSPDEGFRSGYLLPFEIVSVHLLVVLVGAAYLARTRMRVSSGRVRS